MPPSADLTARTRTVLGKKVNRLRREGVVPCNIYGRNVESTAIEVNAFELRRTLRAVGHTGLVRISLGNETPRTALVRQIQRHALSGEFLHIDFQQVSLTERMTVRVPVTLVGRAPVSDIGGIVLQALDHVEVECLPTDIPQHLEVDISSMATTDAVVHIGDITAPQDVTITTDPALVVAGVTMPAAEISEEDAAAGAAGEEAAATEGEVQQ